MTLNLNLFKREVLEAIGGITEDYKFNEGDHRASNPFFRPENVRKVNAFLAEIRPIAESHNATLAQLAIRWTIDRPGMTAALVGARNAKQATENAKAADIAAKIASLRRIRDILVRLSDACGERADGRGERKSTVDCPILEALDGRRPTRKG